MFINDNLDNFRSNQLPRAAKGGFERLLRQRFCYQQSQQYYYPTITTMFLFDNNLDNYFF